jgi:DNA helicase-2/ATP-dependent DNA helicase PcrA
MDENGLKGLEEERRLAYVGLTRARRRALVSYAANRRLHGNWQSAIPSRFVGELPAANVEIAAEPGLSPRAEYVRPLYDWSAPGATDRADLTRIGATLASRPPPTIEGRSAPARDGELRRVGGFAAGDRVFHQKFGYGTVRRVEDNKLDISFDKAGEKKVMDAFVEHTA